MSKTPGFQRSIPVALCMVTCMAFLFGCTPSATKARPEPVNIRLESIIVLPFKDQAALRGVNVLHHCRVCGAVYTTGTVTGGAADFMTQETIRLLKKRNTVSLISNDRVIGVQAYILSKHETEPSPIELIAEIGREIGADAVLVGSVYRFQQRVGQDYSAETPSAVGFDIGLVNSKTGRLLWQKQFDESQQPLSDNLFKIGTFFKRGAKWITAEELAVSGLNNVLETSPIP
ncbi:MAG: hypothetical protein JRH15_13230 [Deltaproteobacteria bacterium]|nr:hypothetical protein [Deltaproteobacteria bacterium]